MDEQTSVKTMWIAEVKIHGQILKAEFMGFKDRYASYRILGHTDIRQVHVYDLVSVEQMDFEV